MADNLIQKSLKSAEKSKFNNVVHRTTTESLRLNESEKTASHPTSLQTSHNPRKISSFQITSVTVGSRVSTDAGDDSADDLDESHTEDISRVTDADTTPSHSEDTFSRDEVFYNASSAALGCAPVIPTSSQYGLAIVGQESAANPPSAPNSNSTDITDMHVSVSQPGAGNIINIIGNAKPQEGMKEIQEHVRNERFKVVKIESTEPFRRGRWMCMDYLDHTTTQPNAPITVNNNLDVSEAKTLQAPDSGVVINDSQHDEMNDLNNRPKDSQGNPPTIQHLDQNIQKQFPMSSPGQSLTQPLNMVQQQMPVVSQPVSVQSPPLEMPQQMQSQSLTATQQVQQHPNQQVQQHPQVPQHPTQQMQQHPMQQVQQLPSQQVQQHPGQQVQQHPSQQVQQHPQSMSHITMQAPGQSHTQPQQQQVQQIPQSFPQHQLQQVITQQGIPVQQIPMHQQIPQQMQPLPNQQLQQMNQHIQQAQMPNLQMQQPMSQMQGLQQNQMAPVPTQQSQMQQIQMQQMQPQPNPQQLHQMQQAQLSQVHHLQGQQGMAAQPAQLQHMPSQAQIQAMQTQQIPNHLQQMQMPPQMTGTGQQMPQMQPQMHQMPTQPQQQVVPGMHPQMQQQSMPTVQPQYNQAVNQQSNQQAMINPNMPPSQQAMVQPQHSVPQYHTQPSQMSQQGQTLPQEVLTNIATSQQGQTLPNNLQAMTSQQGGTLQNLNQPMSQQGMMGLALDGSAGMQHMQPHVMGAYALPHQNIPMSMQQNVPTMGVVQSQTSVALGYVPVMSQGSDPAVSGTNSPVVSLPAAYEPASFASQGNATCVVSSSASEGAPQTDLPVSDMQQAADIADGKEDPQNPPQTEDESASGTNAVAIDNKIEQAMDLVKSHLMFAVREEVEVLKERIAELMERINQLEVENSFLRAHASQDTLSQLPAAGTKPQPPQPPVS